MNAWEYKRETFFKIVRGGIRLYNSKSLKPKIIKTLAWKYLKLYNKCNKKCKK